MHNSARSHPHLARSHPHSARYHPLSARSHPLSHPPVIIELELSCKHLFCLMQGLGYKAEGLLEEDDKKKEDAESGPEDEEVPTRG